MFWWAIGRNGEWREKKNTKEHIALLSGNGRNTKTGRFSGLWGEHKKFWFFEGVRRKGMATGLEGGGD